MEIKRIILILFTGILFFGCEKSIEKKQLELYDKIDTLLVRANNDLLDKKLRLVYTDSISVLLNNIKSDSVYTHYEFKLANRYYNLNLFEKYKSTTLRIQKKQLKIMIL